MAFGFTYTLPTISGSHSDFPVILKTVDFPAASIDGTANAIDNGGGNLRAYEDDTKAVQLSVEIVVFVSSGSPEAQVWIKTTAATSNTIFIEADDVATNQPAVGAAFGRNSVWPDYEIVSHNLTEDSTGNYTGAFSQNGSPTVVDGPFGASGGYSFNGSNQWRDVSMGGRDPLDGVINNQDVTAQAYLSSSSTDSNNRAVHIRNTAWSGIQLLQNGGASNSFGIQSLMGSGNANARYKVSSDASVYNNVVGITEFDGVGAPDAGDLLYIDADSTSQLTSASNLGGGTTGNFIRFGARSDGVGDYFGSISEVRFRKDALSSDWITTEEDNQSSSVAWGVVGAWADDSGATTITPDSINSSQTISESALTQQHIFSVDNISTLQDISESTLLTGVQLLVDPIVNLQTISQPTLTQQNDLSVNNLSSIQNIGNVSLTVSGAINVNNVDSLQEITEPTLTQAHILSVDNIETGQTLSNVLLSVAGALEVQGLTQEQVISNVALVQQHLLSVDGLSQAQALSNVTLAVEGVLSVDSILSEQAVSNSNLITQVALLVDNITNQQFISVVSFDEGQDIGTVTATFKDSGISVKYEDDDISVRYGILNFTVKFKE